VPRSQKLKWSVIQPGIESLSHCAQAGLRGRLEARPQGLNSVKFNSNLPYAGIFLQAFVRSVKRFCLVSLADRGGSSHHVTPYSAAAAFRHETIGSTSPRNRRRHAPARRSIGRRVQRVDLHLDVVISRPAWQIQFRPGAVHGTDALAGGRIKRPRPAASDRSSTKFSTGFDVFRPIHHTSSASACVISRTS